MSTFFDAFSQLGYAAINISIVALLVTFISLTYLRKWLNSPLKKSLYILVCFSLFSMVIIKFAEVSKAMTDAYIANETAKQKKEN